MFDELNEITDSIPLRSLQACRILKDHPKFYFRPKTKVEAQKTRENKQNGAYRPKNHKKSYVVLNLVVGYGKLDI